MLPHEKGDALQTDIGVPFIGSEDVVASYKDDQLFKPVVKDPQG